MNVQDIVTRIRRSFGDEAAVQVTDDDIMRWINDSQIEIVKHNDGALQVTSLINLVANTAEYTLPADLLILRSLRYKFASMQSYSSLKYMQMQQFDESMDGWDGTAYNAGNPQFFTKYENKVMLFPVPEEASTGGLKLLYNQKPTDVTTLASTLSLPLIYHNSVVSYCMWQASLLDEDHEVATMYQSTFKTDMGLLQTRETQEATATYNTITVRLEDM